MMFHLVHVEEHFEGDFELVGIEFNPSGTKTFIYDLTGTDSIKQYSLNSPYNLSNLTLQNNQQEQVTKLSDIEDDPMGFTFSSDGSKMFITGREKDKIQEFNLSTPFDLSDTPKTGVYSIATQIALVGGISFSNDGLKMFVTDGKMMLIKKI